MKKIKRILVANRGEIAVRILNTLRKMKIESVCIYSKVDRDSKAVQMADKSVCVGSARISDSYLNAENIVSAALLTKCDAVHPGFGFLSEDYNFAETCEKVGLVFIGPSASTIKKLGNKFFAKQELETLGVRVIPGSQKEIFNADEAIKIADGIGYPLLLKAVEGGGGKGIRVIKDKEHLQKEFLIAQNEAQLSFGYSGMYIEKMLKNVKHIEVQILADNMGNVFIFPERDCSLQYKHQKFLEETPCVLIDDMQRKVLKRIVGKIITHFGYKSTGTIEFLMTDKNEFFFMEMNTRIQVEHTITEMITGIDFVQSQILIAENNNLSINGINTGGSGHSIEVRINSVNLDNDFSPCCGTISCLEYPKNTRSLRIDSGVSIGSNISPYYDSMIMKVIGCGKNKAEALLNVNKALNKMNIDGVNTNIDFLRFVLQQSIFKSSCYNIQTGNKLVGDFDDERK